MPDATKNHIPPNPLDHQGLVGEIAKRFRGRGLDGWDLFQQGQIGLILACQRFRDDMGYEFSTFAYSYITGYIQKAIHQTPQSQRRQAAVTEKDAQDRLDRVTVRRGKSYRRPMSLAHDESPDVERIRNTLRVLPKRERLVIEMHFGIERDESKSMGEIGKEFGVSKTRVRQLVNSGLKRLKEEFAEMQAQAFAS